MIKYKLDYQNKIKITDEREVVYTISKKHRGRNAEKSHWIVKMPDEEPAYKSRSASKAASAIEFPTDATLQSGDFNEFKLDELELPF